MAFPPVAAPPMEPPKVTPLSGLDNFDDWIESLKARLAHHGLVDFVARRTSGRKPRRGEPEFAEWDKKRQLAKAIIKCSTAGVAVELLASGWSASAKTRESIYKRLSSSWWRAPRPRDSRAPSWSSSATSTVPRSRAWPPTRRGLQTLRRRMTNLGYCPDDKFVRRRVPR